MLKRSLHRVALPALFLLALPSSARAQARDPVAAEALFAEGRAAMKRGDTKYTAVAGTPALRQAIEAGRFEDYAAACMAGWAEGNQPANTDILAP